MESIICLGTNVHKETYSIHCYKSYRKGFNVSSLFVTYTKHCIVIKFLLEIEHYYFS